VQDIHNPIPMATPGKSSRWGSLLQQAVAGVEARLDNILAEGEGSSKPATISQPPPTSLVPQTSASGESERKLFCPA
jgi:TATA element modulatory factor